MDAARLAETRGDVGAAFYLGLSIVAGSLIAGPDGAVARM
jgi:hypothetical protein